jgi:hypothetical protein
MLTWARGWGRCCASSVRGKAEGTGSEGESLEGGPAAKREQGGTPAGAGRHPFAAGYLGPRRALLALPAGSDKDAQTSGCPDRPPITPAGQAP